MICRSSSSAIAQDKDQRSSYGFCWFHLRSGRSHDPVTGHFFAVADDEVVGLDALDSVFCKH